MATRVELVQRANAANDKRKAQRKAFVEVQVGSLVEVIEAGVVMAADKGLFEFCSTYDERDVEVLDTVMAVLRTSWSVTADYDLSDPPGDVVVRVDWKP